jgi:hypothetical protein
VLECRGRCASCSKVLLACSLVCGCRNIRESDDANFINSGCSTSPFPTYTNCFTYHELVVVLYELCSLQNYVCSQKLASDIIHVTADGDGTALPPLSGKKRTKAVFCFRYSYRSCRSKQIKTPWSESASELYRPSDRHLSAK